MDIKHKLKKIGNKCRYEGFHRDFSVACNRHADELLKCRGGGWCLTDRPSIIIPSYIASTSSPIDVQFEKTTQKIQV